MCLRRHFVAHKNCRQLNVVVDGVFDEARNSLVVFARSFDLARLIEISCQHLFGRRRARGHEILLVKLAFSDIVSC